MIVASIVSLGISARARTARHLGIAFREG